MTDKNIDEEENENQNLDDYKINYYPNGFFKEFATGTSILKYKLAIYWIPILLFTVIMFIIVHTVFEAAVYDNNTTKSEIFGSIIAGVVIFVCYFLVDFIYQMMLCKKQSLEKDALNSVINAAHITVIVTLGYILGIFLSDNNAANVELAENEYNKTVAMNQPKINSNAWTGAFTKYRTQSNMELISNKDEEQVIEALLLKTILSSSHNNNIFMAILFYFIGMAYWNPYYGENCSRNRMCK